MCDAIGQAKAIQTYKNHQLSLTSLVCFIGTLQAIAVTFVVEHNPSVWRIGWDMNLLAAAYAVRIRTQVLFNLTWLNSEFCLLKQNNIRYISI